MDMPAARNVAGGRARGGAGFGLGFGALRKTECNRSATIWYSFGFIATGRSRKEDPPPAACVAMLGVPFINNSPISLPVRPIFDWSHSTINTGKGPPRDGGVTCVETPSTLVTSLLM